MQMLVLRVMGGETVSLGVLTTARTWWAAAGRRPVAAVSLALLDDVALDGRAAVVRRRAPVDGQHVARHPDDADRTHACARRTCARYGVGVL